MFAVYPPPLRKLGGAWSQEKVDQFMAELSEQDILPDDYLSELYDGRGADQGRSKVS